MFFRSGLTSFSADNRCWDCALIEIDDVLDTVIPASGRSTRKLLNTHIQNVVLTIHVDGGTIIEQSNYLVSSLYLFYLEHLDVDYTMIPVSLLVLFNLKSIKLME